MSGGSYNYAYHRIQDLADEISPSSPLRKAFKTHLRNIAQACHDIEWADSGDYGPGDEDAAIRRCLGKEANALVLEEAAKAAREAHAELGRALQSLNQTNNQR